MRLVPRSSCLAEISRFLIFKISLTASFLGKHSMTMYRRSCRNGAQLVRPLCGSLLYVPVGFFVPNIPVFSLDMKVSGSLAKEVAIAFRYSARTSQGAV